MALLNFDATKVAPAKALDPVPAGWYDAKVITSELKPTSNGAGTRLNLTFEIIGGQYPGRKVFFGLNIKNDSQDAVRISQEQLSAICHAVGILNLVQSEQLHGHPLKIKVKIQPAAGGYEAKNDISGFEHINFVPATQGAATGQKSSATSTQPAQQRPAAPQQGGFGQQRPQQPGQQGQQGFGNTRPAQSMQQHEHQQPVQQHHPIQQQQPHHQAQMPDQPWEDDANRVLQAVEQQLDNVGGNGGYTADAPWGN